MAEKGDLFGYSLASGDFNGDGKDDLAIGVPTEDHEAESTIRNAGAVNIIYGGANGLTSAGDQLFTQDTDGVRGVAESYDQMGWALTAGDFNNDNRDDLAIGVPGEDVGERDSAGAVHVLYGSGAGLSVTRDLLLTQNTTGVLGDAEAFDRFGSALAAADFNGDHAADLAIGAPWDSIAGEAEVGVVNVVYGTSADAFFGSFGGITVTDDDFWHQDRPGVLGQAEVRDWFGEALATGDFNNDGRADLAIAAPGDSISGISDVGLVNVLYGTGTGLSAAGDQLWHQGSPGVIGDLEARDRMGGRLRSNGVYRIPYKDGSEVKISTDRLTHSPQQDRLDMSGVNGGSEHTIVAARAGKVEAKVDSNAEPTSDNNYVWISHSDGEWSKYSHFATGTVTVNVGDNVSVGQKLGIEGNVGATGTPPAVHLHFEVGVCDNANDCLTSGGFLKGENRDPVICGIPGNTFMAGQTYKADDC